MTAVQRIPTHVREDQIGSHAETLHTAGDQIQTGNSITIGRTFHAFTGE